MSQAPTFYTITIDNVTGAALIAQSIGCVRFVVYENGQVGTDSYTITGPDGTVTVAPGQLRELRVVKGTSFPVGISSGITLKRLNAGTLSFAIEEHGN